MIWGETECLTSLLSACSLSVSQFCRDQVQEDGVGPKKRIFHPLSWFYLFWITHMHCKCQWKRVHILLPSTEVGWVTTVPTEWQYCCFLMVFDLFNWYVSVACPNWNTWSQLILPLLLLFSRAWIWSSPGFEKLPSVEVVQNGSILFKPHQGFVCLDRTIFTLKQLLV